MNDYGIADRMADLGHRVRERVIHSRMEKLGRENERLRTEVGLLRGGLREERGALNEAVKGLEARIVTTKEGRAPHLIRALVIAAGAYVLGTRDGRERYEQIRRRAWSLSRSISRRVMQSREEGAWRELSASKGVAVPSSSSLGSR
jgi:hypothetical protein